MFHVVNEDRNKVKIRFQLELENLWIQGEPEGATEFTVELATGENGNKILKPISPGEGTGIQMEFQC